MGSDEKRKSDRGRECCGLFQSSAEDASPIWALEIDIIGAKIKIMLIYGSCAKT